MDFKLVLHFKNFLFSLERKFQKAFFLLMNTGTVKFFNESKGFGFIIDDDSQTEYFTHVTGLIDDIREGDAVEFELQEGRKGLNAVKVRVVN